MAQEIAEEEELKNKKRELGEGSASNSKRLKTTFNEEEYEEDEEETSAPDNIWMKWKQFLDDPVNTQNLMHLR